MNITIARERRADILKVDSINSTNADFMITHVPFRSICVKKNLASDQREHIPEEEVYTRFFGDSDMYNKHQFIIVEGSSGSGKSHFIRWLNAKLQTFVDNGTDVVLLIRRSDNTLKGTIRQLLKINEVNAIKNKDAYDRLVQANQTISEAKFKEKIYSEFIVEINTSERNDDLTNVQKKQLVALLNNDKFKERMMAIAGPIDRIYQKVAGTESGTVAGADALFEEGDFTLSIEFNEELKYTADKNAVRMADKLIPDDYNESMAKQVTLFMNSFVDGVVRSCAGIETGDFESIFKEIRQELYKQGKNLILLIEDITAFTGINKDLLNALITEHTGLNEADKLCRLISVVGTTTQYYSEFRDNYKDRITSQITIEDGALGNNGQDIVVFCARYLNALSLSESTIQEWYDDGAKEEDYPVHIADLEWASIKVKGKSLNLYPFTKRAIDNLYQNLPVQKTPRYIIKEIIEPAVNDVIANKGIFPLFLREWRCPLRENVESKIFDALNRIEGINDKDKYRNCVLALICYWGDGTLDVDQTKGTIAGIENKIFVKFGLEKFSKYFLGDGDWQDEIGETEFNDIASQSTTVSMPKVEQVNKKYEDLKKTINEWCYYKKIFNKAREIRDALCSFVFDTLNWQQLGVSVAVRDLLKNSSTVNLFSIERQDRANVRGLIEIKASEENKNVLLAIGKFLHVGNKKWDFEGAPEAIYTLTCWLEENKDSIVKAVLENEVDIPTYIQCALLSDLIFMCLNNGGIKKVSEVTAEKFLCDFKQVKGDYYAHSSDWQDLATICNNDNAALNNHKIVLDYFNIVQGSGVTKNFVNHTALEAALKTLEKNKYRIDFSTIGITEITAKKKAIDYANKLYSRIDKVIKAESSYVEEKINLLINLFGYEKGVEIDASDIRDLLTDVAEFYNKVDAYGLTIIQPLAYRAQELKDKSVEIAKLLSQMCGETSTTIPLSYLMKCSDSPMKLINELVEFLSGADSDADKVLPRIEEDKNKLVRSGGWDDNVDPRFEDALNQFEQTNKVD